jgi:hypothetical protein
MTDRADGDGTPLFTLRRSRRMTRTHAVLWTGILLATSADIVLTMVGLANGLREGNAVVAASLSAFGLGGFFLVKFAAMVWLVAGWALLSDRNAAIFLALFAVVTLAVVSHNVAVVAGLAVPWLAGVV